MSTAPLPVCILLFQCDGFIRRNQTCAMRVALDSSSPRFNQLFDVGSREGDGGSFALLGAPVMGAAGGRPGPAVGSTPASYPLVRTRSTLELLQRGDDSALTVPLLYLLTSQDLNEVSMERRKVGDSRGPPGLLRVDLESMF
jgi:hypothetical protein